MFKWKAIYNDNIELDQFVGEKENLFGDIEQDKLIAFRIDNNDKHVIVDLKIGIFMINGTIFEIPNLSFKEDEYRLIYFRRVQQNICVQGEKSSSIESFIGFQITIDDKNHKVMVSVNEQGIHKFHIE